MDVQAHEMGGSDLPQIRAFVVLVCRPLRGLNRAVVILILGLAPPGFMLSSASRTQAKPAPQAEKTFVQSLIRKRMKDV